jgi:4-amino-4-deoxy-L-arabinose transferase-like glycosyltransferase
MSDPEKISSPPSLRGLKWYEADTTPWWTDRAVILVITLLLYLPMLGSFGLWDPWETHYGEVGRQIIERNDWISTWWGSLWKDAGGSQEGAYFFSKPILLMWMMAAGMLVFGFSELGIRIGVALVATLGVLLAYSFGASVFSRRTGWVMAAVMATTPFWFLLGRQAQTDMPFVGLMTVGMLFLLMGLFGKDRDLPADRFSYLLTSLLVGLTVIPQVTLVLAGLSRWRGASNEAANWLTSAPRTGVIVASVLLGVSSLSLIGSLVLVVKQGRLTRLSKRLAWGSLLSLWVPLLGFLVAIQIFATSHSRDLSGWFGWGGVQAALYVTALGITVFLTVAKPEIERRRLYILAFYVFTGLATLAKGLLGFMLPGAIVFFYLLLTREWRLLARLEFARGIPLFIAVTFPWYAAMLVRHTTGFWNRFFVHDHFKRLGAGVHQLDTGSFEHFIKWAAYGLFPWSAFVPAALVRLVSTDALTKRDDESRATLMLVLWAVVGFTLFTLSSTKFHHYIFPAIPAFSLLVALALDDALDSEMPRPWPLYLMAVPLIGFFAWDLILDPGSFKNLFTYKYDREWNNPDWDLSFRWTLGLLTAPALLGALIVLLKNTLARRAGVALIVLSGLTLTVFCLDVYMPRLSQVWSQKGLWDYYYGACTSTTGPDARKRYCAQPVIAYKLNWRGETFYTQNEVIPVRDDDDFDHFLANVGDGPFYGIMEYSRYRGEFQRRLPARFKNKACVVYNENLKFVLAKAPCEANDPERKSETKDGSSH